jgi:hypothetical protein
VENVRENVSGQLSGMSVVQGLVVQDKFLFWQNLPLNNFYFHFGQRDHYLLGETHSKNYQLLSHSSLPLYSLLTSVQELLLWKQKLVWFSGMLV